MKDNVIFWRDWDEAIRTLPEQEQAEGYRAVMDYALNETPYKGKSNGIKMLLQFLKPRIDEQTERYVKACERNRENGKKGGRPKNPQKPKETQENPVGFFGSDLKPNKTQQNPQKPDKGYKDIRIKDNIISSSTIVESDIEKKGTTKRSTPKKNSTSFDVKSYLREKGVTEQHIDEWLQVRKVKRGVNTQTAMDNINGEVLRAGITWDEAVTFCIIKNWVGFRFEWYDREIQQSGYRQQVQILGFPDNFSDEARAAFEADRELKRKAYIKERDERKEREIAEAKRIDMEKAYESIGVKKDE